jgi:hypothetical protein
VQSAWHPRPDTPSASSEHSRRHSTSVGCTSFRDLLKAPFLFAYSFLSAKATSRPRWPMQLLSWTVTSFTIFHSLPGTIPYYFW